MSSQLKCRDCGVMFTPFRGKPGYIDQCPVCATDVDLIGGNMIWQHKTAPELELKSLSKAKEFARLNSRYGAGVTKSLVQSKTTPETRESGKQGSGTEDRAQYTSHLGEKRSVKL